MNTEDILRECKKCHEYKLLKNFGTNKNNNIITYRHTCIKCFGINRKAYLHNFYETKSKPKNEIKRIERNKLKIPKVKKVKNIKVKSAFVQPLLEQLDPPISTPVNLMTGAPYQHMIQP